MYPQFVDFNADGHVDVFAATFDGSPHVAFGSEDGFLEPKHVLEPDGTRVMLTQFWNYDAEKWDEADDTPKGHCTSALAFDWDADGDHDILMGDYKTGRLFRRMNEGTAAEPSFPGPNVPVEVDGEPLEVAGGVTSHLLADWDGDGALDLVVGGYGQAYGDGTGAGIAWLRNTGEPGAPRFAAAETLIPESAGGADGPKRPQTGLYLDAFDWNGDGDLDLVVGGYSHWNPDARELSAAEEKRADELAAEIADHQAEIQKLYARLEDASEEERDELVAEIFGSDSYRELTEAMKEAQAELDELRPRPKREPFVWVYERTGSPQ